MTIDSSHQEALIDNEQQYEQLITVFYKAICIEKLVQVGDMYFEGKYIEQDENKAVEYYKMAGSKIFYNKLMSIGDMYLEMEDPKAVSYYNMIDNDVATEKISEIGYKFFNGEDVEKDEEKALRYYRMLGNVFYIAKLKDIGDEYLILLNEEKAFEYYKKAGEDVYIRKLIKMGNMYCDGIYKNKDYDKAVKYYKMAGNDIYLEKVEMIGDIYVRSNNDKKALEYYILLGNEMYMTKLMSIARDYEIRFKYFSAIKYYEMASIAGNNEATGKIGDLHLDILPPNFIMAQKNYHKLDPSDEMYIKRLEFRAFCGLSHKHSINARTFFEEFIKYTSSCVRQVNDLQEKLSKANELVNELTYRPMGPGYFEAKQRFEATS